jgi:hypothetical protein
MRPISSTRDELFQPARAAYCVLRDPSWTTATIIAAAMTRYRAMSVPEKQI